MKMICHVIESAIIICQCTGLGDGSWHEPTSNHVDSIKVVNRIEALAGRNRVMGVPRRHKLG